MSFASDANVLYDDFIEKALHSAKTGENITYRTSYGSLTIRAYRTNKKYVHVIPDGHVDFSLKTKNKGVLVDISDRKKTMKNLRVALMRTMHQNQAA